MPALPLYDRGMSESAWVVEGSPRIFQLPVIVENGGGVPWSTVYNTVSTLH